MEWLIFELLVCFDNLSIFFLTYFSLETILNEFLLDLLN